jgi:hypothetical protein
MIILRTALVKGKACYGYYILSGEMTKMSQ